MDNEYKYSCPICFDTGPVRWEGNPGPPSSGNRGLLIRDCGAMFTCPDCSFYVNKNCGRRIIFCYRCGSERLPAAWLPANFYPPSWELVP